MKSRTKIGLLRVYFHIDEAQSLKQKRQVMRSIKDRLSNQFNVAVAEIGSNDLWQAGELAVVTVANEHQFVDSMLQKINNFFEEELPIRVIEGRMEILRKVASTGGRSAKSGGLILPDYCSSCRHL